MLSAASTRTYGRDLRDGSRVIGRASAIAAIGAGLIHAAVAADHGDVPVMVVGFAVIALLQVTFGVLLYGGLPTRPVIVAGIALMATATAIWAASRIVGLGLIEGMEAQPMGYRDSVTVALELTAAAGLALLLRARGAALETSLAGAAPGAFAVLVALVVLPAILTGGQRHRDRGGVYHGAGGIDEGVPVAHTNSDGSRPGDREDARRARWIGDRADADGRGGSGGTGQAAAGSTAPAEDTGRRGGHGSDVAALAAANMLGAPVAVAPQAGTATPEPTTGGSPVPGGGGQTPAPGGSGHSSGPPAPATLAPAPAPQQPPQPPPDEMPLVEEVTSGVDALIPDP